MKKISESRYLDCYILALLILVFGCSGERRQPDHVQSPALYGEPTARPSETVARARPNSFNRDWRNAPFAFVQTELSPASLFHCAADEISLFTHLSDYGLGAPTHFACATRAGIKSYAPGEIIDASWLEECWILVWFAGAKGWTNWDSPWAVYLQHKPSAIRLDEAGLHLGFTQSAGYIVLLLLYGYYKPPQKDSSPPSPSPTEKAGVKGRTRSAKKIKTWEWAKTLPREPLMRVRYWASVLREFPIYCEDSFSVDRGKDAVTIRQRFQFHSIDDDWKTGHLKLAPLSPPLAQVVADKGFPVSFSKPVLDHDLFTPYGPYAGIQNVDSYDATFRVLQYVNETEAADPAAVGTNAHPSLQAAINRLQETARKKFREGDRYDYDHGGLKNFCWAIQGDQWYAKSLPYLDAQTREIAVASLRKYFHEDVLVTDRFKLREFPKGSSREYYILEGPGIGSWGVLGDAGKFSANMLETLWAYAHFTGDWDLIKQRWPMIKKLFCTPAETRWVGFGRDAIAELGDEAAPCLAMARLAYKAGDIDCYNYSCYMFARELVHHYVKQRGGDYFRQNQPWHSMEFMDDEVYLTNLWGDTAGWQIDGPNYPRKTGERQYNNRWVRFKDADVGRFYRDYLKADVNRELDLLQQRWEPKRKFHNDSHIMPSLVQLRSLLLNETPAELAEVATPDQFSGPPSGIIASCLSVIRTSHSTHFERLIPGGPPSPFVAGLEREVAGPNPYLVQALQFRSQNKRPGLEAIWPELTWWKSWQTPTGHRWTFGHIQPGTNSVVGSVKVLPLNWNSQAVTYSSE